MGLVLMLNAVVMSLTTATFRSSSKTDQDKRINIWRHHPWPLCIFSGFERDRISVLGEKKRETRIEPGYDINREKVMVDTKRLMLIICPHQTHGSALLP